MSGETSKMMALWRLGIAACRKSPECQSSAADSGGLELCSERVRKVFDSVSAQILGGNGHSFARAQALEA